MPRFPGVTSALGCVIADLRHDQVQTVNLALDDLDAAALDARMVAAGEEARAVVAVAGIAVERIDVLYELDMHYLGQTHTVAVPLPVTLANGRTGIDGSRDRAPRSTRLTARHSAGCLPGIPIQHRVAAHRRHRPAAGVRSLGVRAACRRLVAEAPRAASGRYGSPDAGTRRGFGRGSILPADAVIDAPAVLEQPDATIFIEPGLQGRVDKLGNVIVERSA